MKKIILLLSILLTTQLFSIDKLAILIVIDGLSYDIFEKAIPHFSKGFRHLMDGGTLFTQAHYHYACTSTGPGHTTISTGCWPTTHGIIDNSWYTPEGKKVNCDNDTRPEAALLSDKPITGVGKSGRCIMADGIADQLSLGCAGLTIAISNKSRSAICMSTHLGKALWFDQDLEYEQFITSKAYFDMFPDWLKNVNNNLFVHKHESIQWNSYFPPNHPAYKTVNHCYTYATQPAMINTTRKKDEKKFINFYVHTPAASKTMFQCAQAALQEYKPVQKMLLCIGLDNVDKVGHKFGPDSFEYIDLLYHIDHQIEEFLTFVHTTIKPKELLVCITADHGHFSIPELLADKELSIAKRLVEPTLLEDLNSFILSTYSLKDLILKIDSTSVYFNQAALNTLPPEKQNELINHIKNKLESYEGIKKAWTAQELASLPCTEDSFLQFYKNQLFNNRTALIQIQLFPYSFIGKGPKGTSHTSPYNYTTHVPLLIFNSINPCKKTNGKSVWMTQVAPTIAHFFSIQKPSACLQNFLPVF